MAHPSWSGVRGRPSSVSASFRRGLLSAIALMLALVPAAEAGWLAQGTPVDTQSGAHLGPRVMADGAGGAYVVWTHQDPASHVRVQHLTADGEPATGWSAGGGEVAPAGAARRLLGAGPDGAGGLVVGWLEAGQALAKRLLADGSPAAGWNTGGVVFWTPAPAGDQAIEYFDADGSGGGWFAVQTNSMFCPDICYSSSTLAMHHLSGSGSVEGSYGISSSPYLSGAILTAASTRPGSLIAAGLGGSGLSGQLSRIPTPPGSQWSTDLGMADVDVHGLADDGEGGALVVTEGALGSAPPHLIRRGPGGGNPAGWPVDGVAFRVPDAPMSGIVATDDGAGGVLIAWIESGTSGNELRLQRMTRSGTTAAGWPAAGVVVNDAPGAHTDLRIAADGAGGAFVAWRDLRSDPAGDVFARRVLADGTFDPAFPANGSAIAMLPGAQAGIALATVSPGHAVVAWEDARDGGQPVVYAQRIPVPGTLATPPPEPRGLVLTGFSPNPALGDIRIAFRLPATADASLELFDPLGRRVAGERFTKLPAGEHAIRIPSAGLPAGLYLIRLRAGGTERTARGLLER